MLEFVLECGSVIWHGHISLKLDVWKVGCIVIECENIFREWLGK